MHAPRFRDITEWVLRSPDDKCLGFDRGHLLFGQQVRLTVLHLLEAQQVVNAACELRPVVNRVPHGDEFLGDVGRVEHQELQPATVGIYSFIGAEYADWERVMAFASVFALPVLVIFLLLQRKIVAGLTTGALK